ncbi:MAG: VOC family protein [Planctomycetota bacterium]|jgi:predicted enzyme related to lactoylglutathione lyase
MFDGVGEVLYFVARPEEAAAWYARLLDAGFEPNGPPRLRAGGVEITFHPADEKSGAGTAGQVAYFLVADFDAARERIEAAGASLYRGPLRRPDGKSMAQFLDPFGNVLAILG